MGNEQLGSYRYLLGTVCVFAITATIATPPVAAQETETSAADEESRQDTIVVTARKKSEDLADVPESISVVTEATIENAGIDNVEDLPSLIPNFSVVNTQNPGTFFLNVRGVGQFRNSEPPVAIIVDGVQITSPNQVNQELFDIQQIEVLKGPQGALYGRNAVAGAINIVTKPPTDELEGRVKVGYGNGDNFEALGVVSGPIIEGKLRGRLGATYRDFGGLIKGSTVGTTVDFAENTAIRGALIFEPTDTLSADLRAGYSRIESGSSYWSTPVDESGFFVDDQANNFDFPVSSDVLGMAERELTDVSLKIEKEFGPVTLTSVSAYALIEEFFEQDLDFTAAPVLGFNQTLKSRNISQEIRLSSNSSGRFDWSGGVYLLDTKRDLITATSISFANIGGYVTNAGLFNLDFNETLVPLPPTSTTDNNFAYAFFGNASYEISDTLEFSAGLRYDVDERKQTNNGTLVELEETFDLLQPKLNLLWRPTNNFSAYASWGIGFRSGGFNADATVRDLYDAEEIESFEIGFKAETDIGSFSGAAFRNEFTNRQDFIFIAGVQTILTTPSAELNGLELSYTSAPVGDFNFTLTGGLQDGEVGSNPIGFTAPILDLVGLPAGTDFTGNELPLVYGWSATAAVDYAHEFDSGVELFGRADYSTRGDFFWELSNFDTQDTLHLLNVRAGVRYNGFEVTGWVENALDQDYFTELTSAEFTALPVDQMFPAAPLTYGFSISKRF